MRTPFAALALATTCTLGAQVCVPDSRAGEGPINSVPLGGKGPTGSFQNMRTQILVPASALPQGGATITEVSFSGGSTGSYTYSLLEVRFGHLAGTALGNVFAQNLADETVMLRKTNARVALQLDSFQPLGLTGSFRHDGKRDLVIDIVIQSAFFSGPQPGTRRSSTLPTVFARNYDAKNPAASGYGPLNNGAKLCLTTDKGGPIRIVGSGCKKANGKPVLFSWSGSSARGKSLELRAGDANPGPLTLVLGTSTATFGSLTLPFDLAPIGAPGCLLRTDVAIELAATADAQGAARLPLPIPDNPFLQGRELYCQWLAPDQGANRLGLVLSAMLAVRIE